MSSKVLDFLKSKTALYHLIGIAAFGVAVFFHHRNGKKCNSSKKTIYERLGGEDGMTKAVREFYSRLLKNDKVNQFFQGVDMEQQTIKQIQFLSQAFGGPKNYKGKDMREGHKHLKITEEQYDITVNTLVSVLKDFGVDQETIGEIGNIAQAIRNDVLNK